MVGHIIDQQLKEICGKTNLPQLMMTATINFELPPLTSSRNNRTKWTILESSDLEEADESFSHSGSPVAKKTRFSEQTADETNCKIWE